MSIAIDMLKEYEVRTTVISRTAKEIVDLNTTHTVYLMKNAYDADPNIATSATKKAYCTQR